MHFFYYTNNAKCLTNMRKYYTIFITIRERYTFDVYCKNLNFIFNKQIYNSTKKVIKTNGMKINEL